MSSEACNGSCAQTEKEREKGKDLRAMESSVDHFFLQFLLRTLPRHRSPCQGILLLEFKFFCTKLQPLE
ncbi:hypothetical protein MUK42_37285 [Musa troglodytarum]|uniref:Uncharacterized protein n=1 Tax=Musa troglodytarum TaxID=320322 RepID=A0A9E7JYY1_9LILI|nr:hypothetical protein MUK42_37285 [Musa troglodytarum]